MPHVPFDFRSGHPERSRGVQITWVEGRSPDEKRKLAACITQALVEDGRARRENVHVTFVDVPATDYAEAGVTVADQKRLP